MTSFDKSFTLLYLCLFHVILSSFRAEKHSLYFIYTGLSRPLDLPGIYVFSAMGLLDDRQIDSYNSREQRNIPKQQWMKENMQEDYWENRTQSRKEQQRWFYKNVHLLIDRNRQSTSDLHVLQWRHGCEVEKQGNEHSFNKSINEYGYEGKDFLSFDEAESRWVTAVEEALPTKRKWDSVPILNQYTKDYLEKECVDWLNKFREYADEEFRKASPPDVYKFTKKSTKDETKLKLTCLATGFYPNDVMLNIRRYRVYLPEQETISTGVRPNHDQTFQLSKSVEIKEDQIDNYDCSVSHRTFKQSIIIKWDGTDLDGKYTGYPPETVPVVIGSVLIFLAILGVVVFLVMNYDAVCLPRELQKTESQKTLQNQSSTTEQDSSSTDTTDCTSILPRFNANHQYKVVTKEECI
nr:MHC class I antigen ZJA transcript variant 4 [Danio rerio]